MSEQLPVGHEALGQGSLGEVTSTGRRALQSIPVQLRLVLGTIRMTISELAAIKPGDVVRLDRAVGDPIDVYANEHLIARGQIVIVDNATSTFGLKLVSIVDSSDGS